MVHFLMNAEEKDHCMQALAKMIYSRDKKGKNVLSTYISRDMDLAEYFLDQHISTNEYNRCVEQNKTMSLLFSLETPKTTCYAWMSPQ